MDTEVSVAVTILPHPSVVPVTGMYLRRTIDKVNASSETKLCVGLGVVEGSGHTHFKI